MSRIGKKEINIPEKVEVSITKDDAGMQLVSVKGPKGHLAKSFRPEISIKKEGSLVTVSRNSNVSKVRALHGLSRTLIANMIQGLTEGFKKELEIVGVGYRAKLVGKNLDFQLGKSHPVIVEPPEGIEFQLVDNVNLVVSGYDKELVGQVAANIIALRPPEPYKGKGIKIKGQRIKRKAGKSGKAK
jgi:large subunit ribosomal protein L6